MTIPWSVQVGPHGIGLRPRLTMLMAHRSKHSGEHTRCGIASPPGWVCAEPNLIRQRSHPRLPHVTQWASFSINFEKPQDGQVAVSRASDPHPWKWAVLKVPSVSRGRADTSLRRAHIVQEAPSP